MQRITLIKIEEADDAEIKNNIPVNTEYIGWLKKEPEINQCFYIDLDKFGHRYFRTSLVKEILDRNTFKTCNSIYKMVRDEA